MLLANDEKAARSRSSALSRALLAPLNQVLLLNNSWASQIEMKIAPRCTPNTCLFGPAWFCLVSKTKTKISGWISDAYQVASDATFFLEQPPIDWPNDRSRKESSGVRARGRWRWRWRECVFPLFYVFSRSLESTHELINAPLFVSSPSRVPHLAPFSSSSGSVAEVEAVWEFAIQT